MIKVQRLTMDTSWWIEMNGTRLLVDPWLVGPEIDGFKWLNIQWHTTEPVAISGLPEYDYIIISQSYEDHCHLDTLKLLPKDKPILATPKAYKRLVKVFPKRNILLIKKAGTGGLTKAGGVELGFMHPGNRLDPVYFSLLLSDGFGRSVFYSPHGFKLSSDQMAFVNDFKVDALFTTFTHFVLPKFMGGHVNPGMKNVDYLLDVFEPKHLINTHDEEKEAKGLVSELAKVTYPDYGLIETTYTNFRTIGDYRLRELG